MVPSKLVYSQSIYTVRLLGASNIELEGPSLMKMLLSDAQIRNAQYPHRLMSHSTPCLQLRRSLSHIEVVQHLRLSLPKLRRGGCAT